MNHDSTAVKQAETPEVDAPKVDAGPGPVDPEVLETPFVINDKRFWAKDDEAGDEAPQKPTFVQELEAKLAEKENRLQATLVQYKEALDEFESTKARLRRDIVKEIDAGKRALLGDLLEVVDNLERAIDAANGDANASKTSLLSGVTMVRDQFLAKLQNLGVRRIDALGQPFNPLHFEAISMVPVSDPAQDGLVVGVVRTCYVMGDETLRHGMVAVGKKADAPSES